MGYHMGIYVGVYLQAKNGKTERHRKGYVNSSGKEVDTPFNPQTGEKHEIREFIETVNVNPDPYIECENCGLNEDMFWSPEFDGAPKGYRNFMLNENDPLIHPKSFSSDDGGSMELDDLNVEEAKSKFMTKYKDYIEYYYKEYGEENFEVKYGIIAYWS